jgi:hypothetical protein
MLESVVEDGGLQHHLRGVRSRDRSIALGHCDDGYGLLQASLEL